MYKNFILGMFVILMLTGCGQMGPLYLPVPPKPVTHPPVPVHPVPPPATAAAMGTSNE